MNTRLSALQLLRREWRGGELGLLFVAVVLAVAMVMGISTFVSRLQSTLEAESSRFLAADAVVRSRTAIHTDWFIEAQRDGLSVAQTQVFSTMVIGSEQSMFMTSVKAVSSRYPLRGALAVSRDAFSQPETASAVPAPGEVWLAPRLFGLLNVATGDSVQVGYLALRVAGAIRTEPDAGGSMIGYGPRLMMNIADVPATGVVQPGSQVTYSLLVAGSDVDVETFSERIKPELVQGQRLLALEEGQPSVARALERARGFLLLSGSLAVLLAAAAMALVARRFAERHTDSVAIMKSLGAQQQQISQLYLRALLLLGALATAVGGLLGGLLQLLLFALLEDQIPVAPGAIGALPWLLAGATAAVCLLAFAWPPIRRLAGVPPLRVLRRDIGAIGDQRASELAIAGLSMTGLMWWYSADWRMTAALICGLILTMGCGYVLSRLFLRGSRVAGARAGSAWLLGLAGLQRRRSANAITMTVLAMAIMLMLVVTMIRTSLIEQWRAQLPEGSPNHFVMNVAPDESTRFLATLERNAVETEPLFPMIRGRVIEVNDAVLPEWRNAQGGPRQREANFSWSETLPANNELVSGRWWSEGRDTAEVSLEAEFAASIGAQVGDRLRFDIAGSEFEAEVANIRKLDWQSMQPNFWVVFPEHVLAPYPGMLLTSFHLSTAQKPVLNALVREFPTVSVIELDVAISEIRAIVDQVSQAVEWVLWVTLFAGVLVLLAGVQASMDSRLYENALLRALGARKQILTGALALEFAALGAGAGLLSVGGAELTAWILQSQVLELRYHSTPELWPAAILGGVLLIASFGVVSCRRATTVAPLRVLRELA